jgi:hypothetical protein
MSTCGTKKLRKEVPLLLSSLSLFLSLRLCRFPDHSSEIVLRVYRMGLPLDQGPKASGSQPFFARGPLLSFIHICGPTPHIV